MQALIHGSTIAFLFLLSLQQINLVGYSLVDLSETHKCEFEARRKAELEADLFNLNDAAEILGEHFPESMDLFHVRVDAAKRSISSIVSHIPCALEVCRLVSCEFYAERQFNATLSKNWPNWWIKPAKVSSK